MIRTALTQMFDLRHPIVLAPMGGVSGGRLAAAVTNAGALGFVGGGYGDPAWLRTELDLAQELAQGPWGVGLITWSIRPEALELALSYRPQAFFLSFGDPRPYAKAIRDAGCRLICQVQDIDQVEPALDAGADLIVAEGTEAGGHGGTRSTLPLVPAVIDAAFGVPVLAAGGICDGRGLAAALALGACGAVVGTRFYASAESLGHPEARKRIVAARGGDTTRTHVFDIVRGYDWRGGETGRALRNGFTQRWHGHESDLAAASAQERPAYAAAAAGGNFDVAVTWAGEGIDLIDRVQPAAELVQAIGEQAQAQLAAAAGCLA